MKDVVIVWVEEDSTSLLNLLVQDETFDKLRSLNKKYINGLGTTQEEASWMLDFFYNEDSSFALTKLDKIDNHSSHDGIFIMGCL